MEMPQTSDQLPSKYTPKVKLKIKAISQAVFTSAIRHQLSIEHNQKLKFRLNPSQTNQDILTDEGREMHVQMAIATRKL